jgi:hypothetical protein
MKNWAVCDRTSSRLILGINLAHFIRDEKLSKNLSDDSQYLNPNGTLGNMLF